MSEVDLYWLPLGAGGRFVRINGRLFEAIIASIERRPPLDLYHSALQVIAPQGSFVIEQAPVLNRHGQDRGVVSTGPVGARWAGRLRAFRYEIRCWHNGRIPDVKEAVESPVRFSVGDSQAERLLSLVPSVPALVWGRDQLQTGEMWNSNSIIAWLLERAGFDTGGIIPPRGGRAPGWHAGLTVARQRP